MLAQTLAELAPLELLVAALLFLNLAWIATPRYLLLGALLLSAVALARPALGEALQLRPAAAIVLAHAVLAAAIWVGVRGLQRWARAAVRRSEAALLAMIERDRHPRVVPLR